MRLGRFSQRADMVNRLLSAAVVVLLSVLVSLYAIPVLWENNPGLWHTVIEVQRVFISFSIFMIVWLTYDRASYTNHVLGLGFLVVVCLDLFHMYYFPPLHAYTENSYRLSMWYWVLGRYTEAFVLLLGMSRLQRYSRRFNKWLALALTVFLSLGGALFIIFCPYELPVLSSEGRMTPLKIYLEYGVMALFFVLLLVLHKRSDDNEVITPKCIYISAIITIPAGLCFTLDSAVTSNIVALGHVLKLIAYFYLLKGIVISAVVYPYNQLSEERKTFAGILDDIPIGIIRFNNKLTELLANKRALEIFGCSEDQLKGMTFEDLADKYVLSKDCYNRIAMSVFESNMPVKGMLCSIVNEQGNIVKLRADLHLVEKGIYFLFDDAKKEQQLENLQLQTQTILNSVNNYVLVRDKNNRIITCNKALARIVDMDINDIIGLHMEEFKRIIHLEGRDCLNFDVNMHPAEEPQEFYIITPEGSKRDLVAYETPVVNVDGEHIGVIVVGTDVTLLKSEQERMRQKEKLIILGQMAAGIVHEIKNPLTALKGFCQIVSMTSKEEKTKEYIKIVEQEAERINKIISEFLKFAKPSPPVLKSIDLNELICSLKMIIDTNAFIKNTETTYCLTGHKKRVLADSEQIKQVILNIVQNGIDAMSGKQNPRLSISTGYEEESDEMFIRIVNNGPPIPEEDQKILGTPFFSTKEKGTGLGLSISYQIIEEHQGRVSVVSDEHETAFYLYFPCCGDAVEEANQQNDSQSRMIPLNDVV